MGDLTYTDYITRLDIQTVIQDMGYVNFIKQGKRWPEYKRLDSDGHPVSGDKFIVNPRTKTAWWTGDATNKSYNVISLIKSFPESFSDYTTGMKLDALVNQVCRRLLGQPENERESRVVRAPDSKPFDISAYALTKFDPRMTLFAKTPEEKESRMPNPFWYFFKSREISAGTQKAFGESFLLARKSETEKGIQNLAFPMKVPGADGPDGKIVGLELRGPQRLDGTSGWKGMATGSNASIGMWIASPNSTNLKDAKDVFIFESGYDAMSFFQLQTRKDAQRFTNKRLYDAVYVSTGGQLGEHQAEGILIHSPNAKFHIGFDNDRAGEQFAASFKDVAARLSNSGQLKETTVDIVSRIERILPDEGYKDWNDQLKGEAQKARDKKIDVVEQHTKLTGHDRNHDGHLDNYEAGQKSQYAVHR